MAGETPSLTGEFVGQTHRDLVHTQTHPPVNQHQKGPICLWVEREVTESQQEMNKQHCSLSDPSLTYSVTTQQCGLPCPGEHLRRHPLYVTGALRQKKMAQMKEQIKAPEKTQLSKEEITNLSDAEFKTLVIRMLTEMVEYGRKMEEKAKAMQTEIKQNVQGTNSEG